jgi:maltose-binding protein MalE
MIMKEKAWKKVIMFAAVAVMALSMLAGCTKPPAVEPEPQEAPGVVFDTSSEITVDLTGGGSDE